MAPIPQQRVLKDRRTKNLMRRLKPGDVAVIHHADLDTTAARALIECRVSAVVNAAPCITGRYPNRGPALLLDAGIPVIDNAGDQAFAQVTDGSLGFLDGDSLRFLDGSCVGGELLTTDRVAEKMAAARANLNVELDHFARNTLAFLDNERGLLFDPVDTPQLKTQLAGRHVLIVVRGEGFKADLASLEGYLRDFHPILLAVDGGADALLEAKLRPDIILGDMDSISDDALRCGAELIVHGYPRGDDRGAPGMERIEQLGLSAIVFQAQGTSEDVAMLLADELGARLIVAVGTHFSLEEFLDKGRSGMASTFLTRLRIGSKLVDAKGVARLSEQHRPPINLLALLVFASASPIIAVAIFSPMGQILLRWLTVWVQHAMHGRH
jgi:uncharacterized membrane-anchored protein